MEILHSLVGTGWGQRTLDVGSESQLALTGAERMAPGTLPHPPPHVARVRVDASFRAGVSQTVQLSGSAVEEPLSRQEETPRRAEGRGSEEMHRSRGGRPSLSLQL